MIRNWAGGGSGPWDSEHPARSHQSSVGEMTGAAARSGKPSVRWTWRMNADCSTRSLVGSLPAANSSAVPPTPPPHPTTLFSSFLFRSHVCSAAVLFSVPFVVDALLTWYMLLTRATFSDCYATTPRWKLVAPTAHNHKILIIIVSKNNNGNTTRYTATHRYNAPRGVPRFLYDDFYQIL